MGSLTNNSNDVVTMVTTVPVRRLDGLNLGLTRCDLIKIDIQGSEIAFLSGARNFLEQYKPHILIEISASELKCINSSPRDLLKLIEDFDYLICMLNGKKVLLENIGTDFFISSVLCVPKNILYGKV